MTKKSERRDWRRFAAPAFKQRLWEHLVEAVTSGLDVDVRETMADPDANEEIRAIGMICVWAKFRPAFEILDRVGENYLNDPNLSYGMRAGIQLNKTKRLSLRQKAAQSGHFIGQRYAKLLLEWDGAGRSKLEKLIGFIGRRFGIEPGSDTKRPLLPWRFFVAVAVLESLTARIVPNPKQVKEGAIQTCAAFDLQIGFGDPLLRESKIKEIRRNGCKNWKRVFRDLDLTGLPRQMRRF
jgi:hypothetical protein